jgi:hypothetical protein
MILQQIFQYSMPLSIPFNAQTKPLLQSLPVKAHALAFYDSLAVESDVFLDTLLSIASDFSGQ